MPEYTIEGRADWAKELCASMDSFNMLIAREDCVKFADCVERELRILVLAES